MTFQTEDHEECAHYEIPPHKKPPLFGLDFASPLCDPDGKHKMTKADFIDHWLGHERKMMGLGGWRRVRRLEIMLTADDDERDSGLKRWLKQRRYKQSLKPEPVEKNPVNMDLDSMKRMAAVEANEGIRQRAKKSKIAPSDADDERVMLRKLWNDGVFKEQPSGQPEKRRSPPTGRRDLPDERKVRKRTLKELN